MGYRNSFYHKEELRNLHLATAISAVVLAAAVAAMVTLICHVVRVAQAQQQW